MKIELELPDEMYRFYNKHNDVKTATMLALYNYMKIVEKYDEKRIKTIHNELNHLLSEYLDMSFDIFYKLDDFKRED